MTQFMRPTGTPTTVGWTGSAADVADSGGVNDATFIESPLSPTSASYWDCALSGVTDPNTDEGLVLRFRPVLNLAGGDSKSVTIRLYRSSDGLIIVSQATTVTSPIGEIAVGLTPAQAALIASYSPGALRVRVSAEPAGRAILSQADFTYLGHYVIDGNLAGTDPEWGGCLTHRYVGGQLRLMIWSGGRILEFALPTTYGSAITTVTNSWANLWKQSPPGYWPISNGKYLGIWWDEPAQRLWTTLAVDYPGNAAEGIDFRGIYTHQLNNDGSVGALRGPWKLEGIGQRKMYGGFQAVPAWFQSAYGTGPYCTGWGGYLSLADQYVAASFGGTFYTLPDPTAYSDDTDLPAATVRTGMVHGTRTNRGRRTTTNYRDYYDTQVLGDPPTTEPLGPYDPTNNGGLGTFSYGDSYWNTGCWIDGTSRHGFLAVASLNGGQAYYWGSTLNSTAKQFEVHVFDPAHFGEAIQGGRVATTVQPTTMFEITPPGLGAGRSGNTMAGTIAGATYDSTTRLLYLHGVWITPSIDNRIYVFQVNA